jgi:transposase
MAFVRKVRRRSGQGVVEYLYLVEGYREGGRVRQRVVARLGRADVVARHAESLWALLRPYVREPVGRLEEVAAPQALTYGPVAVARALWEQLGVGEVVEGCCGAEVAERAFVLVAHRLVAPGSEHALAWWLQDSYVVDRWGRRVEPVWQLRGRVRVHSGQLQRWYRTLDRLVEAKERIEEEVYLRLRDLFGLQVELVFYDLTSTYFEGAGPEGLARHGHSRDGRVRDRQVLVGVVMASGWPVASYVFEGHRADRSTVEEVVEDVRRRFCLQRVVWVADRGMVSADALELLRSGQDRYLVGLPRRRSPKAQQILLASRTSSWQALPEGGRVAEVRLPQDPDRYLVVYSPQRLAFERQMRRLSMRRCRDQLRQLQQAVQAGRLRAPEKIGARVASILRRHHGSRYFRWHVDPQGGFHFWVDRARLREELRLEGTYLLQTNDPTLTSLQAVAAYKELQTVEHAFRNLKDTLACRPIYHRTAPRVRGHLFVAHLALLVGCALEKALRKAGLALSLRTALQALQSVRLVTLQLDGHTHHVLTKPHPHAQAVLKAVGLHPLPVPPAPL